MSGIEAVSAAAAILQLVDLGGKLLVTGYEVYKSHEGAARSTIRIKNVCTEVQAISAKLSQSPVRITHLSDNEAALWSLANRAHDLAWHLGLLLDSLRLKRGKETFLSWGAIRQSWRILRQHDKLEGMKEELGEIKSMLDTHLLVLMRDDNSLLVKLVNEEIRVSKYAHNENIGAIQSLNRDLVATMQKHQHDTTAKIQQSKDLLIQVLGDKVAKLADQSADLARSERILQSLSFEDIHRREQHIGDAEENTFSWAFKHWCLGHLHPCGCLCKSLYHCRDCNEHGVLTYALSPCEEEDSYQTHFLDWLKCDTSDPFMITGKAGSGKSTFMKYIADHGKTREALKAWSGVHELVVARFYFWSSGTPMQRSKDGLLQSLLYQILRKAPKLIPNVAPTRWQEATFDSRLPEPWSRREILQTLANINASGALACKFCFFIDGLDEYEGPDLDLVLQIQDLLRGSHVKICLSSRPRNVFQQQFPSKGPHHLLLHDHTKQDLANLVEARLEFVNRMSGIDELHFKRLKTRIVNKSQGVFLWVVLVIREVLNGLEPPFTCAELDERIDSLPATLDDYFQRILDNLHPQHRRPTARLLLYRINGADFSYSHEFAYIVWEQEQRPRNSSNSSGVVTTQGEDFAAPKDWKETIKLLVAKACGDFLDRDTGFFIHRSVPDFLRLSSTTRQLLCLAGWHDSIDIHLALCETHLAALPLITRSPSPDLYPGMRYIVRQFMQTVQRLETCSGRPSMDLLRRFDEHFTARQGSNPEHWSLPFLGRARLAKEHTLLCLAAIFGICRSVEQLLGLLAPKEAADTATRLLQFLVSPALWPSPLPLPVIDVRRQLLDVVPTLCVKGADFNARCDPNTEMRHARQTTVDRTNNNADALLVDHLTLWETMLSQPILKATFAEDLSYLLVIAIDRGADLNCRLPDGCDNIRAALRRKLRRTWGPLEDVEPGIRKVDRALLRRGWMPPNLTSTE